MLIYKVVWFLVNTADGHLRFKIEQHVIIFLKKAENIKIRTVLWMVTYMIL